MFKNTLILTLGVCMVYASRLFAYTPLITSTTFDGVKSDVNLVATSFIGIMVVVAALFMIIRAMTGGR